MVNKMDVIKCPYCGSSSYQKLYSMTTALYNVGNDGELVDAKNEKIITHCYCLNCKKDFSY